MSWEMTTIGNHCTVTSSKRFRLSERSNSGVPFYCSKEIIQKNRGEEITDCDYISEEFYLNIAEKFGVPQESDLLVTTRGTIGVPYLYRRNDRFYFADGNLTWIKDFKETLIPQFLYYWFLTHEGQKKIDAIAKGTAQKAVPIADIKTLEICLPPADVQRRISGILSAYDNLIENNQRQIKLLEEAAQRLYKEWFVDLRFPGYETTHIVDGIPEGWEKDRADSFFNITIGKTPPRTENRWFTSGNKGIPWLSISDMGNDSVFALETSEGLTEEAVKKHNMKVVSSGTILVSFKLTVGRVAISNTEMCTNEAIAHFHIEDDLQRAYTYCYLRNFEYDTLGNTSSISKAVNSKIIKAMPFIMPNKKTVSTFSQIVTPILEEIKNKQMACLKTQEARNRLLPKLMSGEIEV